MRIFTLVATPIVCIALVWITAPSRADVPALRCHGVITFDDAVTRSVTMYVDLPRGEVSAPDCRRYSDLAGFCRGYLLKGAPHQFQFGGAVSPENSRFWADLVSGSSPPRTAAGSRLAAIRVLFLGRCEPARRFP